MKKEEIYLDLSKLSQSDIDWIMSVIPKTNNNYEINRSHKYLIFWNGHQEWEVVHNDIMEHIYDRTEVTFDQFKKLCSEWEYIDALPKQLTELEKECLEMLEEVFYNKTDISELYQKADCLITKLKNHETI